MAFLATGLPRGVRDVIEYAKHASALDPRVGRLLASWESRSRYKQRRLPIEQMCAEAGLSTGEFVGLVARAAFELNGDHAVVQLALNMPAIMNVVIRRALTAKGTKERRMIFQFMGLFSQHRDLGAQ